MPIFGKRRRQAQGDPLQWGLALFVNAPSWAECREAIEDYPELLTDEAERQLEYMTGRYAFADQIQEFHRLVQRRELLRACRRQGIEPTFSRLEAAIFDPYLRTSSDDVRRAIEELRAIPAGSPDLERRVVLLSRALSTFGYLENPVLWAILQYELGAALAQKPGRSEGDVEGAIQAFQRAAQIFTPEFFPLEWADGQSYLGTLFASRDQGEPGDNLERAVAHFGAALQIYTAEEHPEAWASAQSSLGLAYRAREVGDPRENIECAIACQKAALRVYTREGFPDEWAAAQLNLGTAYRLRSDADADRALDCYEAALQVYSEERTPLIWAKAQLALGETYLHRGSGDLAENLERAIAALEAALRVYDPQVAPADWSEAHGLLGEAYVRRPHDDRTANLQRAIAAYQAALKVVTRDTDLETWANLQYNLAAAHFSLMEVNRPYHTQQAVSYFETALDVFDRQPSTEKWAATHAGLAATLPFCSHGDPADNIERALASAQRALEVYTRAAYPREWATLHNSLGLAYLERLVGDPASNREQAIEHYMTALQVRTQAEFPSEWGDTEGNLGIAYLRRLQGPHPENVEHAIEHLERSLSVLTPESNAKRWAEANNSLGAAYGMRGYGNWAENVERAIAHYEAALQIRTPDGLPDKWADTMSNLADAYRVRRRGERADNIARAIEYCQKALRVRTRATRPAAWAETQHNLALAYSADKRGDREANLAQAVASFRQALEVYTPQLFPDRSQGTAHALGTLLLNAERWEEAWQALDTALQAGSNRYRATFSESGRSVALGDHVPVAADAAYCLARMERVPQALEVLESARTRSLAQAMDLNTLQLAMAGAGDRQRLVQVRDRLQSLNAESRLPLGAPQRRTEGELSLALRQAYAELDEVIAHLQEQGPALAPSDLTAQEMAALIPEGTALIVPAVSVVGTVVFVLPGGNAAPELAQVIWCPALTRRSLADLLVERDQEGVAVGGYLVRYLEDDPIAWQASLRDIGQVLWDQLMGPLHQHLQAMNVRQVVLVPQGHLHLLPLHIAWHEGAAGKALYFMDHYEVAYAPSCGVLGRCQAWQADRRAEEAPLSLLAVADPTRDLVYAGVEVDSIVPLLGDQATILAGPGRPGEMCATPAAILEKLPGAAVFHFAGHGEYDWIEPLDSALVCCRSNGTTDQEGRAVVIPEPLTLRELLSGVNLTHLKLVVLSACNTGLTDVGQAADEYVGLPAGFLQAGAPAVVSSLWAVNDFSTSLLMGEFYRRHLEEGEGIVEALRGAQLWLRDLERDDVLDLVEPLRERAQQEDPALFHALDPLYWGLLQGGEEYEHPFAHPYYWGAFMASGALS